jgi:hypothetical protein
MQRSVGVSRALVSAVAGTVVIAASIFGAVGIGVSTAGATTSTSAPPVAAAVVTPWKRQASPNPLGATNSALQGVTCTAPTACTAVGSSGGKTLVEVWNGTAWKIQKSPNPSGATSSTLYALSCLSSTACTAVGYSGGKTLVEVWNGAAWKIQKSPNPTGALNSYLQGVSCLSSTACTAVGYSEDNLGNAVTLAEVWNGLTWTIQSTPNPTSGTLSYLYAVSCTSSTACTAVGAFYTVDNEYAALAEVWNGATWTIPLVPDAAIYGQGFSGVSCASATSCIAVGYSIATGTDPALVEAWNGTKWTILTTPTPLIRGSDTLSGVSCTSSTTCTAVGARGAGTLAEVMNGTKWTVQKSPNPTGAILSYLNGVWCPVAGTCTAAGSFEPSSNLYKTLVEAN